MAKDESRTARLMRRTGRLRAIFGPAAIGDVNAPIKEPTETERRRHEDQMTQFTVEKLPNGQAYLVAKDPSSNLR